MSALMMCPGLIAHVGISAMTRKAAKEDIETLVRSASETREIFTQWESPVWQDRTLPAGLLMLGTIGFVVGFR